MSADKSPRTGAGARASGEAHSPDDGTQDELTMPNGCPPIEKSGASLSRGTTPIAVVQRCNGDGRAAAADGTAQRIGDADADAATARLGIDGEEKSSADAVADTTRVNGVCAGSPIRHRLHRAILPPTQCATADVHTPPPLASFEVAVDAQLTGAAASLPLDDGLPSGDAGAPFALSPPQPDRECPLDACAVNVGDETDAGADDGARRTPSPAPVTLLGVGNDLRRKRIKKVSNYIFGPLLGEGFYGVVRDALDVSGEHVTRCAVKMVALGGSAREDGAPSDSGRRSTRGTADSQEELCSDETAAAAAAAAVDASSTSGSSSDSPTASSVAAGIAFRRDRRVVVPAAQSALRPMGEGTGGLRRVSRDTLVRDAFERERVNLQRFHSKHVIRAMDIFSRYGKQYVVLPIAICSLEQLVDDTKRLPAESEPPQEPVSPLQTSSRRQDGGTRLRQGVPAVAQGEIIDDEATESDGESTSSSSTTRTINSYGGSSRSHTRGDNAQRARAKRELGQAAVVVESCSTTASRTASTASSPVLDVDTGSAAPSFINRARAPLSSGSVDADDAAPSRPPLPSQDRLRASAERADATPAAARSGSLLPPMLIKGIVFQLLSGLLYLHHQNLAHNDVKPSNILLFESGTVQLADLGCVAEHFGDKGTPIYASPELCRNFFGIDGDDSGSSRSASNEEGEDGAAGGRQAAARAGGASATPLTSPLSPAGRVRGVDAKKCDMWCCGLVLYYLITGQCGPLAVHQEIDRLEHARSLDELQPHPARGDSAAPSATPGRLLTRFQVYRGIAAQRTPIDFDGLPDLVVDTSTRGGPTTADLVRCGSSTQLVSAGPSAEDVGAVGGDDDDGGRRPRYAANSVRHLLSRLLEIDPEKRITAEEALTHPWLTLTFKPSDKHKRRHESPRSAAAGGGGTPPKPPSRQAMEDAIQRDVARRVLQSSIVKQLIKKDKERHLQFASDVAHILNMEVPKEVLRTHRCEPAEGDAPEYGDAAIHSAFGQRRSAKASATAAAGGAASGERNSADKTHSSSVPQLRREGGPSALDVAGSAGAAVEGTVVCSFLPARMPPGCVDESLFLPFEEEDYYEQKSGRREFDVRAFRDYPLKLRALREYYFNVVLVACGYRTSPDPQYSIHSIGTTFATMLRRNTSSNNNLPAMVTVGGSAGTPAALTGAHTAAAAATGASGAAATTGTLTPPPNASAIVGSVVIQTGRRTALSGAGPTTRPGSSAAGAAMRSSSSVRADNSSGGAAATAAAGRSGSRNGKRSQSYANANAADEADVAMRESSKCFCGIV